MYQYNDILELTIDAGIKKVAKPLTSKLVLGFIGGAMISLGYLAYIRIAASVGGGLGSFLGSCTFPVGLIVILLAGGELVTGNMMAVSASLWNRRISVSQWAGNLLIITAANAVGALAVAYFFGHVTGLTTSGIYLDEVVHVAEYKLNASWLQCFVSGIGCNWFVGLSVWLCYGTKDAAGKIAAIWFPVMTFVAIGFQHSVANLFILPAAFFEGHATLPQIISNMIPVYLGNIVGGGILVALLYTIAYAHNDH
ncbi:MAG: formate/nitrite transporter family protein [Lachnospiraceae bacterium]